MFIARNMGMSLKVTRGVIAALLQEAAKAAPNECCGLLLGEGGVVSEAHPAALFAAHRAERGGGPPLLGYYHSHPSGHPVPSATDCEHSSGDGRAWAIVAGGEVRFWQDGDGGFVALSHCVVADQSGI
jgi:desampylase